MRTLPKNARAFAASNHGPMLLAEAMPVEFLAADGDSKKLPTFAMTAYTGGAVNVGFGLPVVVELSGVKVRSQNQPAFMNHDHTQIVGHADSVEITAQRIKVSGTISGTGAAAQEVLANSKNGFPYQASIGGNPTRMEYVDQGESVKVNGKNHDGPLYVVRAFDYYETSFVPLGADSATSAKIAARFNGEKTMTAACNTTPTGEVETTKPTEAELKAAQEASTAKAIEEARKQHREAMAKEMEFAASIKAKAGDTIIDTDGKGTMGSLAAHALRAGWTAEKVELEALRASRPQGVHISKGRGLDSPRVIEAAIATAGRFQNLEKRFTDQELQAAHDRYKGRIGLQQILLQAAREGGYEGDNVRADLKGVLRAAFSTIAIPGILSNTANKSIMDGWLGVESEWQKLAKKGTANDFKTMTRYRMTGGLDFEKVGPTGEIKHGTLGETSYTNQVETYAKMLAITRQDIINDDLGALTDIPKRLGRGAALKLNKEFWTEWLADASTFYAVASGTRKANYLSGSPGSLLSFAGLSSAEQMFLDQTDEDGNPLAITPKYLVVPTALKVTAETWMEGGELRDTTASTKVPTKNVHAGKWEVVCSTYLSNANISGYSANAWYLIADPMDLPVIEVAFLNGQETPIVEEADADFNVLGIQMRGYFDFGVNKQEYRAGVKFAGA